MESNKRKLESLGPTEVAVICMALALIIFAISFLFMGKNKQEDSSSNLDSVIQSWYENSTYLNVTFSDGTSTGLVLNSNKEAYMEYGAPRVYLKTDKVWLLAGDVEVIGELSPVRLAEEISEVGKRTVGNIKELEASFKIPDEFKNAEYTSYVVSGYDSMYNMLAVAGTEYASQVMNSLGLENTDTVSIELITFNGVLVYEGTDDTTGELGLADIDGYGTAMVILYYGEEESPYSVYYIQTNTMLKEDFKLDVDWYLDTELDRIAELAVEFRVELTEILKRHGVLGE